MALKIVHTKRDRLEEKEAAIVAAATQLFMEKGLDGTKMVEIAKRTDVAEGTLYLYFKNKNALMMAIVAAHWERITKGAVNSVRKIDGSFEQLEAHAQYHLSMLVKEWKLIDLSFALYFLHRSTETEGAAFKREYALTFDAIFRRGVDRGAFRSDIPLPIARDMFFGSLEYSARTKNMHDGHDDHGEVEQMVTSLVSVLKAGLAPIGGKAAAQKTKDLSAITERLELAVRRFEQANASKSESK